MLVIQPAQMQVIEEFQATRFADQLIDHIRYFAPIQFKAIGIDGVGKITRMGVEHARRHGFTLRGAIRFYVESMFMLGSFFDTDPQYRGITAVLTDKETADESVRADRLYDKIMEYVDAVSGPGHAYEGIALNRALHTPYENVIAFAAWPPSDLVNLLHSIYPEKVEVSGRAAITALVDRAYVMAAERGPSWVVGGPLFGGLMFTFGHGCCADPQYPWIAGTLENAGSTEPTAILERLFRKFLIFLDQARSNPDVR